MSKSVDDWFIWIEATRDTPARTWEKEVLPRAKQALYADLMELLQTGDVSTDPKWNQARDNTIREYRNAIKDYLGIEDVV